MRDAKFQPAADVLAGWRDDVLSGKPPTLFPIGTGELQRVEVGPGLVTLVGGAPGAGKTAFTMQAVIDALRITPDLRAVVCNIEMPPAVLFDRQLARLSGIDLTLIRYRRLTAEHADRIDQALATLESLADRLAFIRTPFDLANVALTADAFDAHLLLLDYIQRIPPPGEHADKRGSVNATMDYLRQFADTGTAVIVISAIGRTKDSKGRSSYAGEGLNLASFRESSEIEFGCDDAFILTPDDEDGEDVTLRHLKSRHGEAIDLPLSFDRKRRRFAPAGEATAKPEKGKLAAKLQSLWNRTPTAVADDAGSGGGCRRMTRIIPIGEEPPPMNGETVHATAKAIKPKGKSGERFAVLNAFTDFTLAELSRAEIAVWLILYRDTRDGTARTSYDDLARRAGCDRRSVGRAIRRLELLGLLKIVHRGGFRSGVSRYRVSALPKEA